MSDWFKPTSASHVSLKDQRYLLVRFSGEVGVKSGRVRVRYERKILKDLLARLDRVKVGYGELHYLFGRVYIPVEDLEVALKEASKVFGVSSVSPALRTSSRLEDVVELGVKIAEASFKPGSTFSIKCRRVGSHPYRSPDVVKVLGSAILARLKDRRVRVDLDRPEFLIGVEVREDVAYVYQGEVEGPGGLPSGSQGRVVCLMSSGLDSPVAVWMMMRRGCIPIILHFDNGPWAGPEVLGKVRDLAKVLASWLPQGRLKLCIVKHGEALTKIVEVGQDKLNCILCKRVMYRLAEQVALKEGARAMVTGEMLGEQASQTLANLQAMGDIVKLPILRPLIGFNKEMVEDLARKVGTYEVSARKELGCKAAPSKPTTRAKLEEVLEVEVKVDLESIIRKEFESIEEIFIE